MEKEKGEWSNDLASCGRVPEEKGQKVFTTMEFQMCDSFEKCQDSTGDSVQMFCSQPQEERKHSRRNTDKIQDYVN